MRTRTRRRIETVGVRAESADAALNNARKRYPRRTIELAALELPYARMQFEAATAWEIHLAELTLKGRSPEEEMQAMYEEEEAS